MKLSQVILKLQRFLTDIFTDSNQLFSFEIEDINYSDSAIEIRTRVCSTSVFPKFTLAEIAHNQQMLFQFSPFDRQILRRLQQGEKIDFQDIKFREGDLLEIVEKNMKPLIVTLRSLRTGLLFRRTPQESISEFGTNAFEKRDYNVLLKLASLENSSSIPTK